MCRDQSFDPDETKVFAAILEFLIRQSTKHQVSEKALSKDLLQMGVAIENCNALIKVFADNFAMLVQNAKNESMRQSQITSLQYSLSYLMATSASGSDASEGGICPLDASVSMNIEVKEHPKTEIKFENVSEDQEQVVQSKTH